MAALGTAAADYLLAMSRCAATDGSPNAAVISQALAYPSQMAASTFDELTALCEKLERSKQTSTNPIEAAALALVSSALADSQWTKIANEATVLREEINPADR